MSKLRIAPLRALSLIAGAVPLLICVMLALLAAERYSLATSRLYAEFLADEVLERAVTYAHQGWSAIQRLEAEGSQDPCSQANLALMQNLTVSSPYLLIVGHVQGDRMMCSSLGRHQPGIAVGAPDVFSQHGVYMRTHLHWPPVPGSPYTLTTHLPSGYSALVLRDWPVAVPRRHEGISLGVHIYSLRKPLAVEGDFVPDWNALTEPSSNTPHLQDQGVVALLRAPEFDFISVAHIPPSYVHREWLRAVKWLLPIGLAVGLVMAWLTLLALRRDHGLVAQLKRALRNDAELHLEYLPIVSLTTGRWVGVEALLRWRKLDGTAVSPDIFIPAAEHGGIMDQVTQKLLALLADDAAQLLHEHPELYIAINLSAADLLSPQIVPQIHDLIAQMKITPRNLQVEATERVMLDAASVQRNLNDLRQLGVQVAIDDFGTGYSNLAYLTELEVDSLKIDKRFVETIGTDAATSQVVDHVIRMARALRLDIIAEGVETPQQAAHLHQHGVPYAQGWLYSRPLRSRALRLALDEQASVARANPAS
jgi:sensor c-di-GMP phosphodiesterase-like protein